MGRDQLEKEMEEEAGFHGIVNIKEARLHARALDEVMKTIQTKVEKEDTKDVAEMAIQQILEETCPMIKDASIKLVLEAIKDPKFMVLQPWLDETEQMMEEITPLEELPQGLDVIRNIDDLDPLTESQKTLLGELFDALEVTHEHLAQACSMLGTLSRTLKSNLLLLVLKIQHMPHDSDECGTRTPQTADYQKKVGVTRQSDRMGETDDDTGPSVKIPETRKS